jgi:S-adenosylmethionine-diacylglycerol 3-amino-3-carboxypropyl transferase
MGGVVRVKFAVVREDADLETELCSKLDARRVLLVASGGCTALTLAHRFPGLRVTAFDQSAAQLAHVEAKRAAVERRDLASLNVGDDSPSGLNQRGEFEGLFRTMRAFVEEFVAPRTDLARYFAPTTSLDERAALVAAWTASRYWPVATALSFHDDFLHAMFGPAATQHAQPGSYPAYFRHAFERGLRDPAGPQNPFLRHVLLGEYDVAAPPDYVHAQRDPGLELVEGTLLDVPDLARFDLFSLSNVFDWSDDALVAAWAGALRRAARPGAAVLVRQLNNRRDVRRFFGDDFFFDEALGAELLRRDRSLFYERIEVGFRIAPPAGRPA